MNIHIHDGPWFMMDHELCKIMIHDRSWLMLDLNWSNVSFLYSLAVMHWNWISVSLASLRTNFCLCYFLVNFGPIKVHLGFIFGPTFCPIFGPNYSHICNSIFDHTFGSILLRFGYIKTLIKSLSINTFEFETTEVNILPTVRRH